MLSDVNDMVNFRHRYYMSHLTCRWKSIQFVIEETWYVRISVYSFGSQLGISSGPAAFRGFNFSSADSIADSDRSAVCVPFRRGGIDSNL